MAHNRKYVPGSVALTLGRVRHNYSFSDQNGIERFIIDSGMLENAPFKWIGLMYRYGKKNNLTPQYDKMEIDPKDGEIAVAIELKWKVLEWADLHNLKLMYDIHMIGALEAIIHIGKKYKLPIELIEAERAKYGNIPEDIEECKNYPAATIEDYRFLKEKFGRDINLCSNCGAVKATPKARQCLVCGEFNDPQLV